MRVVIFGLVGLLFCLFLSARLYPGGTWTRPDAEGFSFWHNYWCDLLSPVAIGGGDHWLGAWLARLGFAAFTVGLWAFWPLAARSSGGGRGARTAVRSGRAGALALVAVSFVPSAVSEVVHGVLVTVSAGASLVAALILIVVLSPRTDGLTNLLGAAVALASAVCLGQYLRQGIARADYADWLAGAQKIATAFLLLWMVRLLWLDRRREHVRTLNPPS